MRKYSYLLSALFAGISIASISAPSQAQRVNRRVRDYSYYIQRSITASNLAYSAGNSCYRDKNLEECDKLIKIENVVSNWCVQGDSVACSTYSTILSQENVTRTIYSN